LTFGRSGAEAPECQKLKVRKIKSGGLDQCRAELFKQQQFGTVGIEGVNRQIV